MVAFATGSLLLCGIIAVFVVGVWETPYDTTDSVGRTMGFNDRFSWEHYGIIFSNFNFWRLMTLDYTYTWLLLLAHAVGLRILLSSDGERLIRLQWFFGVQALFFPIGLYGVFFLPYILRMMVGGALDREGVVDVPFIAFSAQGIWLFASFAIFFVIRRQAAAGLLNVDLRERASTTGY